MTTKFLRNMAFGMLLGLGWFCIAPTVSWAQAPAGSRGGFNLGTLEGVFTVEDFKVINGVSQAGGWLTGTVTDTSGTNQVGNFTNFPVRMPLSGLLQDTNIDLGIIQDPVTLPQLSTNTCDILGVVIGAIDVTLPGLGVNVHLNAISLVVRADHAATIGDLLCNILGSNGILGKSVPGPGGMPTIQSLAQTGSAPSVLTMDQLRGLLGILLGAGLQDSAGPGALQVTAGANSGKRPLNSPADPMAGLQGFLQRVITTMQPATPAASQTK